MSKYIQISTDYMCSKCVAKKERSCGLEKRFMSLAVPVTIVN